MNDIVNLIIGVIGAIVSACIGAIVTKYLLSRDEKNKANTEINNAKSNLKTEFEINKRKLEEYNEKYLKLNLSRIYYLDKNDSYINFYKNLDSFPILNHNYWDNTQNIINEIFTDDQIKSIIEFNTRCDKLREKSVKLNKKYDNEKFKENILKEEPTKEKREAYLDIKNFEEEISKAIHYGNLILIPFEYF